jgi:hypothetical protein
MGEGPDRGLPTWVAAVLLVVYAAVGVVMLVEARHDPDLWTKEVHLFDALTPIATGAVGWIFGREVHRKAAADYKEDADNGKNLAGAVKCVGRSSSGDPAERLAQLVSHAVKLFPDSTDPDPDPDG